LISASCVNETNKIINNINCIQQNNETSLNNFNFFKMIEKVLSDTLFLYSAKTMVILNHFIFSIVCIIAISKTITMIIPVKIISDYNLTSSNNELLILGTIFLIFLFVFILNKYAKTYFNYLLMIISIILLITIIVNLIKLKQFFNFHRIPIIGNLGVEYIYVSYCILT